MPDRRENTPTAFWGKLSRDAEGQLTSWHGLASHSMDVALVTEGLLTRTILGRRLATLGNERALNASQVGLLCVIAALHDIGKFSREFQAKALPGATKSSANHVAAGSSLAVAALLARKSATAWFRQMFSRLPAWESARGPLIAAIGHHGSPCETVLHFDVDWEARPYHGVTPREGISELFDLCVQTFPDAFRSDSKGLPSSPSFQHAFAGLVMLADWVGSDTDFFEFNQSRCDATYISARRARVDCCLAAIGLDLTGSRTRLQTTPLRFEDLSEEGHPPRPAQQAIRDIDIGQSPSIIALEAETGAGKTEAAFYYYLRLLRAGEVDSLYFALPTRTSALQIHRRIVAMTRRVFRDWAPPVVLAVPGYLQVDDRSGARLPDFDVLWPDVEDERNRHRGWAAEHSKRYLAGAISIGTIDQALLSVLPVRHSHLRATALLRSLLVIDEVHASDSYMTELTSSLVKRHSDAGGHALLMSATLGGETLRKLLGAPVRKGVSFDEALAAPFPSVSSARAGGQIVSQPVAATAETKRIQFELRPDIDSPDAVAAEALHAAANGARVIVLRNLVRGCNDTLLSLQRLASAKNQSRLLFHVDTPAGSLSVPHHSRFSVGDRRLLDNAVDQAFGKDSNRSAGGLVVVATQTIQQSLDLDADIMITDLCPADVLLQRAGRLHRHESHSRPKGYESPRLVILTPPSRDLAAFVTRHGGARGPHGFGPVYDDLRVLDATWSWLEQCPNAPEIRVPDDCRSFVETATHHESLTKCQNGKLQRHGAVVSGTRVSERQLADVNAYSWGSRFDNLKNLTAFPGRDEKIGARLGEQDRRVVFAPPVVSPIGSLVKDLSIPHWMVRDAAGEDFQAKSVDVRPDVVYFSFGSQKYQYDKFGLSVCGDDHGQPESD